jgi:hypothetical protein
LVGSPDTVILSTSTALVPRPASVVHDVNGYYRELGVRSDATRRQLMEAYRARGGENDARLTMIFCTLLNPKQRAAYDALPPGRPMLDQPAVEEILAQASLRASRENAENGTAKTGVDILSSLGIDLEEPRDEFLASDAGDGFDDVRKRDRQPSSNPPAAWPYSYLLLGSTCDDIIRLAIWQAGLGHALADRDCPQFAVGFHGIPDLPFVVSKDLGIPVVFLHEAAQVTGELIAAAATAAVG